MPETCENYSCIYFACQTCEIYQVLPYSLDFKAPVELRSPLSKTVLSKYDFVMTVKLKSNLYIGPVNIFPTFWHFKWLVLCYVFFAGHFYLYYSGLLQRQQGSHIASLPEVTLKEYG